MKKITLFLSCSLLLIFCTSILSAQHLSLDPDFAKKGIRKITFKKGFFVRKLLKQADGKLLVIGSVGNKRKTYKGIPETDLALFRFDADGQLDKSFGKKGKVIIDIDNQSDQIGSAALQSDGKIVVTGSTGKKGISTFVVLRFLPDGSLDTSFGKGGQEMTKVGEGSNTGTDVLLQKDGKIVLVGHFYDGYDEDFVLLRYTSDGQLDTSFGKAGKVITDFDGHNDDAKEALLLDDGRMLVGGTHDELGKARNFALACYLPDGKIDKNFGTNGQAKTNRLGVTDEILGLLVDPSGAIKIVGRSIDRKNYSSKLTFVRFTKDGQLERGKYDAIVEYKTSSKTIFPGAIWKQSDGKILIGGGVKRPGDAKNKGLDFGISRYLPEIEIDPTFNGTGLMKSVVDKKSSFLTSMIQLADEKIVVLGTIKQKKHKSKLILARYAF